MLCTSIKLRLSLLYSIGKSIRLQLRAVLMGYRLNGDYNPLHATPEPGQKMGFGGAIMSVLFSYKKAILNRGLQS
jgi:hypothetical protein